MEWRREKIPKGIQGKKEGWKVTSELILFHFFNSFCSLISKQLFFSSATMLFYYILKVLKTSEIFHKTLLDFTICPITFKQTNMHFISLLFHFSLL